MEEFEFPCPKCGEPLISDEETAGKEAVCPYCDKLILMPKQAQAQTIRPPASVKSWNSHLPSRRQSGTPLPEAPVVNSESQEAVINSAGKSMGAPPAFRRERRVRRVKI